MNGHAIRKRSSRVGLALIGGLLAAGVVAISGCADRPGPPAGVTLVFKHARILGQGNPIPRLIAEFEARHPGVHVQAEALPWNSDEQRQFFVINLEADSPGFDVMMLDVIWVPEFARAGWLLDLTRTSRRMSSPPSFPRPWRRPPTAGGSGACPGT